MSAESFRDKASKIYEGWTTEPAVNEDWFIKRMEICHTCPLNSANKNKNLIEKSKEFLFREPFCTACGCPLSKKLTVKRSVCGLEDLGKEPLWGALTVEGKNNLKQTYVENPGSESFSVKQISGVYVLDFGKTSEDTVPVFFKIFVPIQYKYVTAIASCGCTQLAITELGKGIYQVTGKISTKSFHTGHPTIRTAELRFDQGKIIPLQFKIEKL